MSQRHRPHQSGKKQQTKHGFVERFFRVTPTRNAAFISKLFSMVDDEVTKDLITWTGSGDQFTVFNNTEFSRIVLPRYFKHCNWSSFVRQLNMYDFHKINENTNDEDQLNNNNLNGGESSSTTTREHTMIEPQAQRWDFKHPWFNKAGFDRLHKIRRKPPRNRLIPQIRYSSAMEILPSNSPDYEQSGVGVQRSSNASSSSATTGGEHDHGSPHHLQSQQTSPAVHDTIHQLQDTTGNLESKLEFTANEVQYLRKVTESQQEILNELIASVEYLKSKYNITDNVFNSQTRKPRKIHELLGSNTESQNMDYKPYSVEHNNSRHEMIDPSQSQRQQSQSQQQQQQQHHAHHQHPHNNNNTYNSQHHPQQQYHHQQGLPPPQQYHPHPQQQHPYPPQLHHSNSKSMEDIQQMGGNTGGKSSRSSSKSSTTTTTITTTTTNTRSRYDSTPK